MSASLEGRTIVALACFDSFAKTAMVMLSHCRRQGAKTSLQLVEIPSRKLSKRQRIEVQRADGDVEIHRHPWTGIRELCSKLINSCDVLLLCLDGQRSRDVYLILEQITRKEGKPPLLVSAYPGILFRHQMEGMMDRSGVDLLCLNSEADLNTYIAGCESLGMESKNAVLTGLPILWDLKPRQQRLDRSCLVFFEQPSIPAHPLQRRYLCKQLQRLAQAWPDHPVIFKPRTGSLESTLHRHNGEMGEIIRRMGQQTKNLSVSLQPTARLLGNCGCAMTVSSTAALESMVMGVSTRIIADLGLNESLGNHYFIGSGSVATFQQIIDDPFSILHDTDWLQRTGWAADGSERFLKALYEDLTATNQQRSLPKHGTRGWGSEEWRDFALAHGGRRMLSTAGALSSRKKRNHGIRLARRIREKLVSLWGVEEWIKG